MKKKGRPTSLIEAIYGSAFIWLRQTIFPLGILDGMLGLKIAKQKTLAIFLATLKTFAFQRKKTWLFCHRERKGRLK